jgi:hypothetical protein
MNLKAVFASFLLCSALWSQSAAPASTKDKAKPTTAPSPTSTPKATTAGTRYRYQPARFAARAGTYYRLLWGIDSLSVKSAESGEVIRFSYRVLDTDKAKTLGDKKQEPSLVDDQAHVKLVVPMMDKVGKLRQTGTPESGKTYWMLFSNKGGYVKRGDRVSVVIGGFRADGLVVD